MSLEKKVCLSLLTTLLFCLPFAAFGRFFTASRSKVLPLKRQSETVPNITARVGEYEIGILSGWTSPYAEVDLNGQGTARKTLADENGYFEFLFVPVKKLYGELCLTSQDVNLIPTLPVCLPAIPPTDNIEVVGVLLPPSISLEKGKIIYGESTKASGMTFPNSEIDVYLFENKRLNLIPPVLAAGLPKYSVQSNKDGYYEFSLPATQSAKNRLFATAKPTLLSLNPPLPSLDARAQNPPALRAPSLDAREQNPPALRAPSLDREGVFFYSPKSNTLSYSVIKTNYFWLLLLLPIVLILLILWRKKKNRSIMIITKPTLIPSLDPPEAGRQGGNNLPCQGEIMRGF